MDRLKEYNEEGKIILLHYEGKLHIPQNLRIRSEGTERHSALN